MVNSVAKLQFSTTIVNAVSWESHLQCNDTPQLSTVIPFTSKQKICSPSDISFKWKFHKTGKHQCVLHFTDGIITTVISQRFIFDVYPKLQKATIVVRNTVKTNEAIPIIINILPRSHTTINLRILNTYNNSTVFKSTSSVFLNLFSTSYSFIEEGRFIIHVFAFNPVSQVHTETSVAVKDPITDLIVEPSRSVLFVKTNSEIKFRASFTKGTDVQCKWTVHCSMCNPLQKKIYSFAIINCYFVHTFVLVGICNLSLSVTNEISAASPPFAWKVFVEEPITNLQVSVPEAVLSQSVVKIEAFIPNMFHEVDVIVRTKSSRVKAQYDPETSIYRAELMTGSEKTVEWIGIRGFNNVSQSVSRHPVLVIPQIGEVSIRSCGCFLVGNSAQFLVLIDGGFQTTEYKSLLLQHCDDPSFSRKIDESSNKPIAVGQRESTVHCASKTLYR
ncbi:uncharacterized protein CDAR_85061 [Caerostris darwini]|uniref:Uncharacterized protein n=1 Tax=Caerostris darwini TaxID=1538125 RepID=A0AAV4MZ27_9ARAC|nr:uncharacterized protein CDAR_85061 [Caerostris darwini]